ncbi:MAG: MarR family winged helix-turn-helix transcriptional regulator [Acidimicrobiales bacterium]
MTRSGKQPEDQSSSRHQVVERERADAFLGLVLASNDLVRILDRSLKDEHGLSLHEFEVLLFLAAFCEDRAMQMTELRRRTPLSQSRVSRVVSGLESKGLVRRATDPTDNRGLTVAITPQGLIAFETAKGCHRNDLEEHLFSILTDREIRQLGSITAKILAAGPRRPYSSQTQETAR